MTPLTVNQIPKLTVKADNVFKDHRQSQEHRALEMLLDFSFSYCTAEMIHGPCV